MVILHTEEVSLKNLSIKYYEDFLSISLKKDLLSKAKPYSHIEGLKHIGESHGLENESSLRFICELYEKVYGKLNQVLTQRIKDRKFLDERTKALSVYNQENQIDYQSENYQSALSLEDGDGRIVFGPLSSDYAKASSDKIAPIPTYLQGDHVTLFGPPDTAKMSINAMNAYHRKIKNEPAVIETLLNLHPSLPKWGADDEDSKTPLREDLISAGINLTGCLNKTLSFEDQKKYSLEANNLSIPIKRFPGLALPSFFLFYKDEPMPLHLYDFGLHLFENWHNKQALCFYVPKLENEEEASYIRFMLHTAEEMIKSIHPEYEIGSIRLMIVLENPRAIFRANEIMSALYPYFLGASLGWHDFLASTARLFKEDSNYRIPVKADPDIVIKYIKASHDLLADVVGPRGGIKVGGMYGILPIDQNLHGKSYQLTLKGFFKDVITQLKRGLDGFWVAHPDFVRLGLALVSAWKEFSLGKKNYLYELVDSLFLKEHHEDLLKFINGSDIQGLDKSNPLYARSLIVADIKESEFIANNHPEEIRYNVFQSLQYITDWLSGNGCVALPAHLGDTPVRVMDDLATAERSRWEVWHELYHQRFSLDDFLAIVHEEFNFIRRDLSNEKKIVQVKWNEQTAKWYPIAKNLMIKLMTDKNPVEFATQLLLPFTIEETRESSDPWSKLVHLDPAKFEIDQYILRFNYYFEICGSTKLASTLAKNLITDLDLGKKIVSSLTKEEIIYAASFHGDIGGNKKILDHFASKEQEKVFSEQDQILSELQKLGDDYRKKFGVKFLISAANKTGAELLEQLKLRINNSEAEELHNARLALWEISKKRFLSSPINNLVHQIEDLRKEFQIKDVQISLNLNGHIQNLNFGNLDKNAYFEFASLSKTIACAFAVEYFAKKNISLKTSVNSLLDQTKSTFRIPNGDDVLIENLMNHTALNLHYVNGVPANKKMPPIRDFLIGNNEYKYDPIKVINSPGSVFKYSGAGFLVLEHLIESLEEGSIYDLTREFLNNLGLKNFTFFQESLKDKTYAHGFKDSGELVEGTRKMFPAFAAGGMGTSEAMAIFLSHLEKAFHQIDGSSVLSHDTARFMLHGIDKGCLDFMGVKIGFGVFIGEAGENKFAIHQGANDGFRAIYLHCFDGPDRGKGFVVFCNSDVKGVFFNSLVSQILLQEMNFSGINFDLFKKDFNWNSLPEEQIVNLGYKQLVFNAFSPNLPEKIARVEVKNALQSFNILTNAEIEKCSNQKFARAENLISNDEPTFIPDLFGKQGKVMDSWETVRHNQEGVDELILKLKEASVVKYIFISTAYHFGNHAPFISLWGLDELNEWKEFLSKTPLEGHSEKRITLSKETNRFSKIKVQIFPDGGLTRLSLYKELPNEVIPLFVSPEKAISKAYPVEIPQTKKPLTLKFKTNEEEIKKKWAQLEPGETFDICSLNFGAKIVSATNEHYAPAAQMISPYPALNMFDGLESARSRIKDNFEKVEISFFKEGIINEVEIDFHYFINNNPMYVSMKGITEHGEMEIIPKSFVKPFAGGIKTFKINSNYLFKGVILYTYPCGGLNRLKIFSKK